jgi:hypothetical protein
MKVTNPEQTASIFSLITYYFSEGLIFKARKTLHLGYEELPVLADYDRADTLKKRSFLVRHFSLHQQDELNQWALVFGYLLWSSQATFILRTGHDILHGAGCIELVHDCGTSWRACGPCRRK